MPVPLINSALDTIGSARDRNAGKIGVAMDRLANSFVGSWQVRRTVVDHLNRAKHRFAGTATVTETLISERGELQIGTATVEANRSYQLAMDDDGISVRFPTGLDFVRLGLAPNQIAHHHCGSDMYRGKFLFRNTNFWIEFWRVNGPRKRYSSLTSYRRIG